MLYKKLFAVLFVALFALSPALGLSPARIDIPFEPNATMTFSFKVLPGATPFVKFSAAGELANYITFSQTEAVVNSKLRSNEFQFTVKMPSFLAPGLHDTRIVVTEYPQGFTTAGAGAGVSAKVAVELQLWVREPYPGKYLEVTKFSVENTPGGQNASIRLEAVHRGNESINRASAVFDIFNADGVKLASLSDPGGSILPGQAVVFEQAWPTGYNPPGKYRADAVLSYDGSVQQASVSFKVGAELVEITNISVQDISPGGIARFKINTESFWEENIPNVFTEVNVLNAAEGSSRSDSKTVPAWGTQDFVVFWDSKSTRIGRYNVDVTIHFLGKTRTEQTVLNVVEKPFEVPWLLVGGAAAALVLLYGAYRFGLPWLARLRGSGKKRKRGVSGELEVRGDRAGEPIALVLHAFNNSNEAIDAEAVFEVFDSQGSGVASIKAGAQKIAGGKGTDFSAKLPASKAKAGGYLVSATLSYGDRDAVTEKKFSLQEEEQAPWEKFK